MARFLPMQFLAPAPNCGHVRYVATILVSQESYSKHVRPHPCHILWITVNPSLRPEFVRILAKDTLVSVDDPAIHPDDTVLWNMLPVQSNTTFGTAALQDEPGAWVDPKCLVGNS